MRSEKSAKTKLTVDVKTTVKVGGSVDAKVGGKTGVYIDAKFSTRVASSAKKSTAQK